MFYLRHLIAIMLLAGMVSIHAPASANNVAVVNIQKIMRESKAANAVRDQVQKKQKSYQSELDQKEKQLQQEDQELAKQRNVLSQEAFQKKYTAFREKAATAQKEVRVKRSKLDKGLAKALGEIQEKVTGIVEQVAKEKGYDIAVSGTTVLYVSSSEDITDEVLGRLDSQMPNINVSFN